MLNMPFRFVFTCLFVLSLLPFRLSANEQKCDSALWFDDWYCELNNSMYNSVYEMNTWFASVDNNPNEQPVASGRIRLGWEPRSGELNEFDSRFKVRVKLPALENRVELLFTDEEDDINEKPLKAARNRELGNQQEATVAIQFKAPESKLAYRVGFGRGGQLYARSRYYDKWRVADNLQINYFSEVHYYSRDRLGAELNARLIRAITPDSHIEFKNSFRYLAQTNNWYWQHEFNYLHQMQDTRSWMFTLLVDGTSRPNYRQEQALTSLRYKRSILRPWLFVEIEPYVIWLREENFRSSIGIAMRAEVHFSTL